MNFTNQVILITGSSRGLGLAFAKCIAAAGATVIVNSTGRDSSGDKAAQEIAAAGRSAMHIPCRVEESQKLVDAVVQRCGRIDGIVHNAGFVQDRTIRKLDMQQWNAVLDVHLKSAFGLTQAAWPHFEDQQLGRLVFISSSSGLYGNFGQGNYAAAKAGLHGLSQTIALEGARSNIKCNCVAPFGATTMNSANLPDALINLAKTDLVAPIVGYLVHPDCQESGGLFEATSGVYRKVRLESSKGLTLNVREPISIQDIADGWDDVTDFSETEHPTDMSDSLRRMYERNAG